MTEKKPTPVAPGEIIDEFEAGGKNVVVRAVREDDLEACLAHINSLVAEKAYIAWQAPFTLEQERQWLEGELKSMESGARVTLVVEAAGRVVGSAAVWKSPEHAKRHRAEAGIGLSSERGIGVGYRLMQAIEKLAAVRLGCSIMEISVYEKNTPAMALYRKCGFREFGRLPKGCNYYGTLIDEIFLTKELRS